METVSGMREASGRATRRRTRGAYHGPRLHATLGRGDRHPVKTGTDWCLSAIMVNRMAI